MWISLLVVHVLYLSFIRFYTFVKTFGLLLLFFFVNRRSSKYWLTVGVLVDQYSFLKSSEISHKGLL